MTHKPPQCLLDIVGSSRCSKLLLEECHDSCYEKGHHRAGSALCWSKQGKSGPENGFVSVCVRDGMGEK